MACPRTPPHFRPSRRRVWGSFFSALGGIFYLPLDAWQRLFLGITVVFLVFSAFTLAKVVRDNQEATTGARSTRRGPLEKLLAEHDPFATAS